MRHFRVAALLALGLAAAPAALRAQEPAPAPGARPDSALPDRRGRSLRRPSATAAMLRSFVLPGWGQAYVGAPGRGAVYFAAETGSLWMVYKSRSERAAARRQSDWLVRQGELTETARFPLLRTRDQQVEDWITLSVFFVLFSGADAYVAAQLADFGAHVGVLPEPQGGARLEVSVPVGR